MNQQPASGDATPPVAAGGTDIEIDAEGNVVIPAPSAVAIVETPPTTEESI